MQNNGTTPAETSSLEPLTNVSNDDLLANWYRTQANLAWYKESEMNLRKEIVARMFDPDKETGTETIPMGEFGWQLQCIKKLDYKLNSDTVNDVLSHFDENLAALLVKWDATLSLSNYNKLTPESKALFDDCLTIKPATPSLKPIPPKVPR